MSEKQEKKVSVAGSCLILLLLVVCLVLPHVALPVFEKILPPVVGPLVNIVLALSLAKVWIMLGPHNDGGFVMLYGCFLIGVVASNAWAVLFSLAVLLGQIWP